MPFSLQTVLDAIKLAGSATPAFAALFEQAVQVFAPHEQEQLKAEYAKARANADDAQADFDKASGGG